MNESIEARARHPLADLMRNLVLPLLLLAFLAALAPAGAAQETLPFSPARDLESFEEASFSPYSDLYPLQEFQDLEGQTLSKEELAAVRARWKDLRAKAETKIATIKSDPREQSWYDRRKLLAKSEFFSSREFHEARIGGRTMLLLEKPEAETAGWVERIAAEITPWLRKIEPLFVASFAKPLGLSRQPGAAADIVCLLRDEEAYRGYLGAARVPTAEVAPASWDLVHRITVGYPDDFTKELSPVQARYPVLREYVRQLESAHCSGAGNRVLPVWVEEGIASYLAWHAEDDPETLARRAIDPDRLAAVVEASEDDVLRSVLLLPLGGLVELRDVEAVLSRATKEAEARGAAQLDWKRVMRAFYAQSTLWVHFLRDGDQGFHRPAFEKYLASVFAGDGSQEKFVASFEGVDLATLDKQFLTYVYDLYEEAFPGATTDRRAIETIALERQSSPGGAPKPKAAKGADSAAPTMPRPSDSFRPADLAPAADDVEARHALAIARARAGELAAAAEILEKLVAEPRAAGKPRIERELERVRDLAKLRLGFLEHLSKTKGTWLTQWKGRTMSTGIQKVEGDTVFFQNNKLGFAKAPLSQVSPYEVARQAGKAEQQGGAGPSTRAYAYLLHGDEKWDNLLKDDPGSQALREDAKKSYPDLLRTAEAALKLEELSKKELPKNAKEAKAVCDGLRAFLASDIGVPLVRRKLPELEQLAIHALSKTFVDQDPKALARGEFTTLSGGRAKIVYEFDKADEAQDFVQEIGVLPQLRRKLQPTALKEEESGWTVEDGAFAGSGSTSYRLFVGFRAPLELRWSVVVTPGEVEEPAPLTMRVSVCEEGPEQSISCVNFGNLIVVDEPAKHLQEERSPEEEAVQYEQVYELELRHDGTTVSTWLDGTQKFEAPAGPRAGGWVRLWLHSDDRLAIERLEIEGEIDPKTVDANKALRFRKELQDLGFP